MLLVLTVTPVYADYNYTPWINSIESAKAMRISKIITNINIRDINDNKPSIELDDLRDSFVYDKKVYIADAKKNKVHVFNEDFNYLESYPNDNTPEKQLNNPRGIFVADEKLYIADTENFRIVIFDINTKEIVNEIKNPNDEIFEKIRFRPQKLVVDRTGRMMVIAQDVFEGIMEFEPNGTFSRYFGTNVVNLNLFEALIYRLSTKEQKEKMALNLQTSFTSVDIDDYGYIYTVSSREANTPVKKLNFKGKNILLNNGYINIVGDAEYNQRNNRIPIGPSSVIDVSVNSDNNRFSILDNKRGRVFTYDLEGHLLYIFGQLGSQNDMLQGPTSVSYFGEKVIVTDNITKSIIIYEPTNFGELINDATHAYYDMDYETSKDLWEEVIKENANYFLAYAGIGKTQLRNEEWEEAIFNLKLGHDYFNYSKAYEAYRNEQIKIYLPYVIVLGFALFGFGLFRSIKVAIHREKSGLDD